MGKHAFWTVSFQCLAKSLSESELFTKQITVVFDNLSNI